MAGTAERVQITIIHPRKAYQTIMSRTSRFTVLIALLFAAVAQAQLVINPTTTYTAETSKNTSASSMFTDTYFITKQNATVTNGDAVPRNVSKVNIHELYPNNNTK